MPFLFILYCCLMPIYNVTQWICEHTLVSRFSSYMTVTDLVHFTDPKEFHNTTIAEFNAKSSKYWKIKLDLAIFFNCSRFSTCFWAVGSLFKFPRAIESPSANITVFRK